jgi:TPR repeat protein
MYHLAICYDFGRGVPKDQVEAVRLYKLAVERGNSEAMFNLAKCYEKGEGVERPEKRSGRKAIASCCRCFICEERVKNVFGRENIGRNDPQSAH